MTEQEIEILKKRLTTDHLVNHTRIFSFGEGDPETVMEMSKRFEQYWKTWIEKDLEELFKTLKND
jgi:hypothetical protein